MAWASFDSRIAGIARQFEDFRNAEAQGAIKSAESIAELAQICDLPLAALERSLTTITPGTRDAFGRVFGPTPLAAPYCAVRVTGALFHTQGGLDVTPQGQVRKADGRLFPNLYAAGGAAVGVSGKGDSGYLSGNGLLSAVVLGRAAGMAG